MLRNSAAQHRVKHFNLLLARELSLIERTHSQNLITHQKLENSIRRANNQILNNNRTKISIPFDNIYNEQTESIDYHKLRMNDNNNNSNQKRRLSVGTCSNLSQNQTNSDQIDEFSDDTSSFISLRRRRLCTKTQRLPPIVKATISNRQKRENKAHQWMINLPQSNKSKENLNEQLIILNDESSKSNLPELTPIQRQVRSFLETLPTYKGVQHGFDSFAPASLYSNRAPVAIR
ncbi:unnamed protein product [Rotaria sordida]|uniref:Uncharacterized protein n=1 Tax=Rotaria sordida TaxID=392033 RepID=A0A814D2U2_9BILA|nr:unnamed protein product [Rotaria sordida]CAF1061593.1 unnamed protein product [Rotaria sordida]CAF3631583.1 unnamed protein product [Rotaria sordida]CAF3820353.1 unnamed protein product [Rotaria sordida]